MVPVVRRGGVVRRVHRISRAVEMCGRAQTRSSLYRWPRSKAERGLVQCWGRTYSATGADIRITSRGLGPLGGSGCRHRQGREHARVKVHFALDPNEKLSIGAGQRLELDPLFTAESGDLHGGSGGVRHPEGAAWHRDPTGPIATQLRGNDKQCHGTTPAEVLRCRCRRDALQPRRRTAAHRPARVESADPPPRA